MNISEKIRRARKEAGFTQSELAEKLGVSQAMISAYEKGLRNPKLETLQKIANVLKVNIFSLMDHDVYQMKYDIMPHANPITGELEFSETEYIDLTDRAKYIDCYDNLNALGKEEALKRVEELTEIKKYTE